MQLQFHKYHGAGNDFIILDGRSKLPELTQRFVSQLCNRHFGVGADGLIVLENEAIANFRMRYFNADGMPGSLCGNGGRCVTQFAADLGIIQDKATFLTSDGLHHAEILQDGKVKLGMKNVSEFEHLGEDLVINTGSPHYIRYVSDVEQIDILSAGRAIRYSEAFKTDGINVNFVSGGDDSLQIRTYERGVEDETLACGTGVTAVAIAQCLRSELQGAQEICIKAKGGNLEVHLLAEGYLFSNISLIGPAKHVFSGTINSGLLQ